MADFNKNQQSIIRQNQIRFVFDYTKSLGVNLTLKEIVGITNVMVDYCDNGYNKDISERLDTIDKHLASKFEEQL